jgi:hypothetical protein
MAIGKSDVDPYVLDSIVDDVEDLEHILADLNGTETTDGKPFWQREFTRDEVVAALSRMIRNGDVYVLASAPDGLSMYPLPIGVFPPGSYDDVYFGPTERGRLRHANWNPDR